jgi:hypothetical protein
VVAEDDVIPGTRVDRVATRAAEDEVVPDPGRDRVGRPRRDIDALDQVEGRDVARPRDVLQVPVVPEDDVVTGTSVDRVAAPPKSRSPPPLPWIVSVPP